MFVGVICTQLSCYLQEETPKEEDDEEKIEEVKDEEETKEKKKKKVLHHTWLASSYIYCYFVILQCTIC